MLFAAALFSLLALGGCSGEHSWTLPCRLSIKGREYTGNISTTAGGFTCKKWVDQYPDVQNYDVGEFFPEDSIWDVENYCRNPDGEFAGLWCYTTDEKKRRDRCDIPVCSADTFYIAKTCKLSEMGVEYGGTLAHTRTGKQCQRWDVQRPHRHEQTDARLFPTILALDQAENYCRNPDSSDGGPWCYTTDPDTRWDYCDVPCCVPDCSATSQYDDVFHELYMAGTPSGMGPVPHTATTAMPGATYFGPPPPPVDVNCWEMTIGYGLFAASDKQIDDTLPDLCLAACLEETEFTCRSVDYVTRNRNCQLYSQTRDALRNDYSTHPESIHYDRIQGC